MKTILITGATGYIGRALTQRLIDDGFRVIALSRSPENARTILPASVKCLPWDGSTVGEWGSAIEESDGVVNLAGENIGNRLWSESFKRKILESRLNAGKAIAEAIQKASPKPGFLFQASAIGYYGSRGDEILGEDASKGSGFMADVVDQWEASVAPVTESGVRVVYLRTGVVLGKGSGLISRMQLPFKLFIGGPPGSGRQWFSWIHLADEVGSIRYLMEMEAAGGIYNLVAPNPLLMREFCRLFGQALHRPSWLPVPAPILKQIFRDFAEEAILSSQRVIPQRLLKAGYQFRFPHLPEALQEIFSS